MTHTPGPWKARINATGIDVIKDDDSAFGIVDLGLRSELRSANYPMEEAEANARLIAAAPELLGALQELKSWVGKLQDWKGVGDPPYQAANLAIQKATQP